MAAKTSMSVAVLTTVVDSLKQQVHSAVDIFCTEALRTSSELTGDGLETAVVTLSAVLDQLKDKGDQASTDSSKAKLSSAVSSSVSSGKEVAVVDDETQNVLLSRMNRLERSMLEVVQKGEQMEERQKGLEETSATKTELCDLQGQLTSRMCPLESSLKGLESEVQSRFAHVSQELGMNKEAIFSFETDVCLLEGSVSQVQEKMSDIEKKVSHVENRICGIEERLKKAKLKEKNQMKNLSSKQDQLTLLIEKKVDNLEKLKAILNELKDRTTDRDALSSKVDQMEQNLSQLSQTVGKLHQKMSPPPIAFCARLAEDTVVKIRQNERISKFSKVICNAGNTLDATTGIFTAPQDGLYGIAAQILGLYDEKSEYRVVRIKRRRISTGVEEDMAELPVQPGGFGSSNTSIMRLKTGDQVFLYVTRAYDGAELSPTSTFAGWLIR